MGMAQLRGRSIGTVGIGQLRAGAQTPYLRPTTFQNITTDATLSSNYIKLDNGEYVNKIDYDKLSIEQQATLKAQGISAFNKSEKAKVIEALKDLVILDNGEYVSKSSYETMSPELQSELKRLGVDAYNAKMQTDNNALLANLVKLDAGDYVDKVAFGSLSADNQTLLNKLGVDAFNKQISSSNVTGAGDYVYIGNRGKDEFVLGSVFNGLSTDNQNLLVELGADAYNAQSSEPIQIITGETSNFDSKKAAQAIVTDYQSNPQKYGAKVTVEDIQKVLAAEPTELVTLSTGEQVAGGKQPTETEVAYQKFITQYAGAISGDTVNISQAISLGATDDELFQQGFSEAQVIGAKTYNYLVETYPQIFIDSAINDTQTDESGTAKNVGSYNLENSDGTSDKINNKNNTSIDIELALSLGVTVQQLLDVGLDISSISIAQAYIDFKIKYPDVVTGNSIDIAQAITLGATDEELASINITPEQISNAKEYNNFISSNIKLDTGEYVEAAAFNALSESDRALLQQLGIKNYSIEKTRETVAALNNEGALYTYNQAVLRGLNAVEALAETNNYITVSGQADLVGWANNLAAGTDARNAYEYSLNNGNSALESAQYAWDYVSNLYSTSAEGMKATRINEIVAEMSGVGGTPQVVSLPVLTQRLQEENLIAADQEVTGYGGNGITISSIKIPIQEGVVSKEVLDYLLAHPEEIKSTTEGAIDFTIASTSLSKMGYDTQTILNTIPAYNQVQKAQAQQDALDKINAAMLIKEMPTFTVSSSDVAFIEDLKSKGYTDKQINQAILDKSKSSDFVTTETEYQYTGESLALYLRNNPDTGIENLKTAGFDESVINNVIELSNQPYDEVTGFYRENTAPNFEEYNSGRNADLILQAQNIVKQFQSTEEGKSLIARYSASGVMTPLELADPDFYAKYKMVMEETQNEYISKYGADSYWGSKFSTVASMVFAPARAIAPDVTIKDISGAEWAIGTGQVLAYAAMPFGGITGGILGKALDVGASAAFGVNSALRWSDPDYTLGERMLDIGGNLAFLVLPYVAARFGEAATITSGLKNSETRALMVNAEKAGVAAKKVSMLEGLASFSDNAMYSPQIGSRLQTARGELNTYTTRFLDGLSRLDEIDPKLLSMLETESGFTNISKSTVNLGKAAKELKNAQEETFGVQSSLQGFGDTSGTVGQTGRIYNKGTVASEEVLASEKKLSKAQIAFDKAMEEYAEVFVKPYTESLPTNLYSEYGVITKEWKQSIDYAIKSLSNSENQLKTAREQVDIIAGKKSNVPSSLEDFSNMSIAQKLAKLEDNPIISSPELIALQKQSIKEGDELVIRASEDAVKKAAKKLANDKKILEELKYYMSIGKEPTPEIKSWVRNKRWVETGSEKAERILAESPTEWIGTAKEYVRPLTEKEKLFIYKKSIEVTPEGVTMRDIQKIPKKGVFKKSPIEVTLDDVIDTYNKTTENPSTINEAFARETMGSILSQPSLDVSIYKALTPDDKALYLDDLLKKRVSGTSSRSIGTSVLKDNYKYIGGKYWLTTPDGAILKEVPKSEALTMGRYSDTQEIIASTSGGIGYGYKEGKITSGTHYYNIMEDNPMYKWTIEEGIGDIPSGNPPSPSTVSTAFDVKTLPKIAAETFNLKPGYQYKNGMYWRPANIGGRPEAPGGTYRFSPDGTWVAVPKKEAMASSLLSPVNNIIPANLMLAAIRPEVMGILEGSYGVDTNEIAGIDNINEAELERIALKLNMTEQDITILNNAKVLPEVVVNEAIQTLPMEQSLLLTQAIVNSYPQIATKISMIPKVIEWQQANTMVSPDTDANIKEWQQVGAMIEPTVSSKITEEQLAQIRNAQQIIAKINADINQSVSKQATVKQEQQIQQAQHTISQVLQEVDTSTDTMTKTSTESPQSDITQRIIPPPDYIEEQRIQEKINKKLKVSKKDLKKLEDIKKRREYQGAIAFKHGFGWVAIKEPYGENDVAFFYGKIPPAGITPVEGGKGAAYRSIQQYLVDKDMPDLHIKRGIMKIDIVKPTKEPGAEGAITFTTTQRGRPESDDSDNNIDMEFGTVRDIEIKKVDLSAGEDDLWQDEEPNVQAPRIEAQEQSQSIEQIMPAQAIKSQPQKVKKSNTPSGFQLG